MGDTPLDLPKNIEAEQCVLGAMLNSSAVVDSVVDSLAPEDFYHPHHAVIFRSIMDLYRRGESCDVVSLTDYLAGRGLLERAGGPAYLLEILDNAPAPDLVPSYVKIVKEKSLLRKVIRAAKDIISKCYNDGGESFEDLMEGIERTFFEATQGGLAEKTFYPVGELVEDVFDRITRLRRRGGAIPTGIQTGFFELDSLTSGLHESDLIIVAGRPGMGKTAFVINLCQNIALRERIPCAFFSLEMSKEHIVTRMLCSEAEVNSQKLRLGSISDADFERLTSAADKLSEAPIYIDDTPGITPFDLRARARRLKKEAGIGLIAIDYLQLMRLKGKKDTREQEISEISRSLKAIAKELNIPVVAISQLNRSVESRPDKRPQLSDLRESGAIEQDADLILFIYRREVYFPDDEESRGKAEIIIGKQRNGPSGNSVELRFFPEFTSFRNP